MLFVKQLQVKAVHQSDLQVSRSTGDQPLLGDREAVMQAGGHNLILGGGSGFHDISHMCLIQLRPLYVNRPVNSYAYIRESTY